MNSAMPVKPVEFYYFNHRGETARRRVLPMQIWYGVTDWHPVPQWFLTAFDLEKQAERDFSMRDITSWGDA